MTASRRQVLFSLGLAAGVVLGIVVMKLYTRHVWEDFFITYRHSENAVAGHGLVYQAGERVHGFTSPVNVLLPALFHALQPAGDHRFPLWAYTACALLALAAGLSVFAHRRLAPDGPAGRREMLLLALLLLLQIKLTAFTFNGQEAGFWAGGLLLALVALDAGVARHWRTLGLAFAGLMWTRPDSPVHIVLLGAAALAFPADDRAGTLRGLLKAAAVCTLLYLPWFAWAWWYYGSPVPHTILAKLGGYGGSGGLLAWLQQWPAAAGRAFEPIYAEAGGWPRWLRLVALAAGLVGAFSWLRPGLPPMLRRASLVYCGAVAYLAVIGSHGFIFPWYFVPACTMGAVVLAGSLVRLQPRWLGLLAGLPLVAALGYGTVNSLAQLRVHQVIVEEQTRTPLGRWLRANVAERETIFLEPIGYIGYYSQRRILDWPGLVSPAVVAARRAHQGSLWATVAQLQPDWLVLRPSEAAGFRGQPGLAARYQAVVEVDNVARLQPYRELPGYAFLSSDARFIVFRRLAPERE
jgi:hypothetical protein